MDMNRLLISFKYLLAIIIIFFSFEITSASIKNTNEIKHNLYIIGSKSGFIYEKIIVSKLFDKLNQSFKLVDLSQEDLSIYDKLDILEKTSKKSNVLIILDDFYIESILYEIDYKKKICGNNEELCRNVSYISYEDMYLPVISMIHKRLKEMFNYDQQKIVFIVSENRNIKKEKIAQSKYFEEKKGFCFIKSTETIEIKEINCIVKNYL